MTLNLWGELGEQEQERIRNAIKRLLTANFLVREKDREMYAVMRRHHDSLKQYFTFLGWEFVLDDRHECVYVHIPDRGLRQALDRDLSIWVLVLRFLYQEKRQELSISTVPMVTVHEIRSKYEAFRLPWLKKTKLERAVRLCVRYHLADVLDADIRADDCRIALYHTWLYVVDTEELDVIREKIERYGVSEDRGLFHEDDAQAAVD